MKRTQKAQAKKLAQLQGDQTSTPRSKTKDTLDQFELL